MNLWWEGFNQVSTEYQWYESIFKEYFCEEFLNQVYVLWNIKVLFQLQTFIRDHAILEEEISELL